MTDFYIESIKSKQGYKTKREPAHVDCFEMTVYAEQSDSWEETLSKGAELAQRIEAYEIFTPDQVANIARDSENTEGRSVVLAIWGALERQREALMDMYIKTHKTTGVENAKEVLMEILSTAAGVNKALDSLIRALCERGVDRPEFVEERFVQSVGVWWKDIYTPALKELQESASVTSSEPDQEPTDD